MAEDWLQTYLEMTEGLPTPPLFRLWSGISTIAAALERRVWLSTSRSVLYPNLFILLVGPPGSGKSVAIKPGRKLLLATKKIMMAPTDMTKAAMVDVLAANRRRVLIAGETIEYHPLCVVLSEFGTLVSSYDLDFMSLINTAFDNEDVSSQRRGHNAGKLIDIKEANINILAGTQPGYLSELLPDTAWTMGFAARLLMIYAPNAPSIDPFDTGEDQGARFVALRDALTAFTKLVGAFAISDEAKMLFRLWNSAGLKPVPEHSRLAHYRSRRLQYVLKLSMIAAVSRTGLTTIASEDVERAKSWLLAAETLMPDIFRDMAMKSDVALMNELHRYAFSTWIASHPKDVTKRTPLHESDLMRFLALRAPAHVAKKVLELMVQADWFAQDHNNPRLYVPRTRGFRTDE